MNKVNTEPEILVIDDNADFAQSAAELIQTKYGLVSIPLCGRENVLESLKHNIIKVVVIDQVMPEIKGTELFQEIKKISPTSRAIMLTGEATSDDIGKAMNMGFSSYLNKNDIKKLPYYVFKEYVEYEKSHSKNINKNVLFTERKLVIFPVISYSIVSIEKSNTNYVFDDSWNTAITIHAGEEQELEYSVDFEDKITITEEYENKIKGELEISGSNNMIILKNAINTELNSKYNTQHTISKKASQKSKKKWSLPKEPSDSSNSYIIKRVIENAPIYNEYTVVIRKECKICKNSRIFPITIYKQTNKIKTRQIDYYNDGAKKETDTGMEKF